jgi:hypothetical protein
LFDGRFVSLSLLLFLQYVFAFALIIVLREHGLMWGRGNRGRRSHGNPNRLHLLAHLRVEGAQLGERLFLLFSTTPCFVRIPLLLDFFLIMIRVG